MSTHPRWQACMRILPLAAWHGLKVGLAGGLLIAVIGWPMAVFEIDLRNPVIIAILAISVTAVLIPVSLWEARRSHLAERMRAAASHER
jgi:thiol:disulfide interchange protein